MTAVAIIGAGKVGTALARTAMRAGHAVTLVSASTLEDTRMIADIVASGATVDTAPRATATARISILAIPLHKYRTLDQAVFAGRVVIDAMNYWPPVNGVLADFERAPSSVVIAAQLPGARLVKTLNHIGYHEVETGGLPPGTPSRRALGLASDDVEAERAVAAFIDSLGYDPVGIGSLGASAPLEPGTPIFSERMTAPELRDEITSLSTSKERSWN